MKKVDKSILMAGSLVAVTLCAGAILSSTKVKADDVSTTHASTASVTVQASCTMTGTVDTPHTTNATSGEYKYDIGQTTIKTFCNDPSGYALYAIGYSNDTEGTTVLKSSLGSTYDIATGTAQSGNTSNWAMKVNKVTDTSASYNPANLTITGGYDSYSAVPSNYAQVANYTASTDQTVGSSVTTTYAVYLAGTQPAGTYTGKVKYIMVHPNSYAPGTFTLVYNANDGTSTSTEITVNNLTNYEPYTIANNTFTRSGYEFKGWCTTNTSQYSCADGTMYQPNDSVTSLGTAGSTVYLYAIWGALPTMQEFATNGQCSSMSTGDTLALTDSRDGTSYTVGKLADGNCWMLDNLALDLTNSTVLSAMNSTNTHASDTTLGYLKNGGGTTSDQYATAAVANWTSSYSYSAPLVNMGSKDLPTSGDTSISGVDTTSWKYGGYYNYCAASAGSYCYGNGTSAGTSSGNATEDICPAGWRMPTGNTGEFRALGTAITGVSTGNYTDDNYTNYRSALHLPLSGYYYGGSAYNQGSAGGWWSSTRYNNYIMYSLNAGTSTIIPANSYNRYGGYSLRCVAGS